MPVLLALLTAAVAATTGAAALYCARRRRWTRSALRGAAGDLLGWLGLFACFYAFDMFAMVVLIRLARAATGTFLSYYLANDLSLPVMAALQAALFRFWGLRCQACRPSAGAPPAAPASDSRAPERLR